MRLSISNIAWDHCEDKEIAHLLRGYGVDAIDIAPAKYFSNPLSASKKDVVCIREWWQNLGFEIVGMQALLFGTTGLNIFASDSTQDAMLAHLDSICRIGALTGAKKLVFGSPKSRDRAGFSDHDSMEIAVKFFRRLGDIAESHEVLICLEPNPKCYGANFMLNSAQTAQVVDEVNHSSIKMQLDIGAMIINGENPATILRNYAGLIGHIHASEPNLIPLGDSGFQHSDLYPLLSKYLPKHIVAIEMLATANEPHLSSIERALKVAVSSYQGPSGITR